MSGVDYSEYGEDNTGKLFNLRLRHKTQRLPTLMRNPTLLRCENCINELLWVVVDNSSHGVAGLVHFECPKCRWATNDVQLSKPQTNAEVAHDLGIGDSESEAMHRGVFLPQPTLMEWVLGGDEDDE